MGNCISSSSAPSGEDYKEVMKSSLVSKKTAPEVLQNELLIFANYDGKEEELRVSLLEDESWDSKTCGWLVKEVAEQLEEMGCFETVAGLKVRYGDNEMKDMCLMDFDRCLSFISPSDYLDVVFADCGEKGCVFGKSIKEEVPQKGHVTFGDFQFVKTIGEGASCSVALVRKKDSGKLYAVKMMAKSRVLGDQKSVDKLITERMVLMKSRHPFIIQAPWCFQTKTHLMFVLEFCAGGELFFHLKRRGRFSEDEARFFFGEIILAIEYLHLQGVVYRDLKPENVLLDVDGHIRLTDFGLSKRESKWTPDNQPQFSSFAGTPHYMAPEMLRRERHEGKPLDFYTMGCLLYVMLSGSLPHFKGDVDTMLKERAAGALVDHPPWVSQDAQHLIDGLMHPDPAERLGVKQGAKEIRMHPWFEGLNFRRLYEKKILPPFEPSLEETNFDPEFTKKGKPEAIREYERATTKDSDWGSKGESLGQKVTNFSYMR